MAKLPPEPDLAFLALLRVVSPGLVADVGSFNGRHALRFRRILRRARVVAFEANADNYQAMADNPALTSANIELRHAAVFDHADGLEFLVTPPDDDDPLAALQGSAMRRTDIARPNTRSIRVDTVRLETLLSDSVVEGAALWIDAEGAAFEVLSGVGSARPKVELVHVEVETLPYWEGQKLQPDVERVLESWDLIKVCEGTPADQRDLVYIARRVLEAHRGRVRLALAAASLVGALRRRLPNDEQSALRRFIRRTLRLPLDG